MVRKNRESYKIYDAIKKMNTTQRVRAGLVKKNENFGCWYLEMKKTM